MARNETKIEITAEDKTSAAFASVSNRLLGVEQSFAKVGGLIGGLSAAAAVGFVVQSVKNAADFADAMGKAAQKVGTTTEALSGLKYAADLSDVSFEQLQTGMTKLAKTTEDFRDGSKSAIDAFAKIKLDPTQFKDTSDLLGAVADKLAKMEDGSRKTAIAQELLGKSGAQLLPLLNGGADGLKKWADEADRFGLIVSGVSAKAAEDFNDNLTRIEANGRGLAVSIGNKLIPALVELTDNFLVNAEKSGLFLASLMSIGDALKIGFYGVKENIDVSSAGLIRDLEKEINTLESSIKRLKSSGGGALNNLFAGGSATELEQKLKITKTQLDLYKKYGEQLDKNLPSSKPANKESAGTLLGTRTAKTSTGKSAAEKEAEDIAKLMKAFSDATAPTQTLSEKLQAQLDVYSSLDPMVKSYLQGIIAQTKATEDYVIANEQKAESDQRILDMMTAVQAGDDAMQALYNANVDTYTAILQEAEDINTSLIVNDEARAKRQLEIEHERRLARIDLMEGEAEQIDAIREAENNRYAAAQKAMSQGLAKTSNAGKELGLTFTSAFEDAIVSGKKFSDVLKGVEQDIARILIRKSITEPLANVFSGIGDKAGSLFSGLFSANANGGVYSGAGISSYSGQVVSSPTVFPFAKGVGLMGEAGPEAILPLTRINGKLGVQANASSGNGVVVNVINNGKDQVRTETSQQDGQTRVDVIIEQVENAISRNLARGSGALAQTGERVYGWNRAAGAVR